MNLVQVPAVWCALCIVRAYFLVYMLLQSGEHF